MTELYPSIAVHTWEQATALYTGLFSEPVSISSKQNSSGALVDDFAHCELSLIALASEDEISKAGVDVEGLILKDIVSGYLLLLTIWNSTLRKREPFFLTVVPWEVVIDVGWDVTRPYSLEIHQSVFGVNTTNIHFASSPGHQTVLRGVVGVFWQEPSAFWEGVEGAIGKLVGWQLCGRSSALVFALYRFVGLRILGVVEWDSSSAEVTEIGILQ
jgi:hypothetical protein